MAVSLVLSERTVERHIANLYAKINVRNRAGASAYAAGCGLI
jgi:DNA-binding CsgD family transcriptional regulator